MLDREIIIAGSAAFLGAVVGAVLSSIATIQINKRAARDAAIASQTTAAFSIALEIDANAFTVDDLSKKLKADVKASSAKSFAVDYFPLLETVACDLSRSRDAFALQNRAFASEVQTFCLSALQVNQQLTHLERYRLAPHSDEALAAVDAKLEQQIEAYKAASVSIRKSLAFLAD